MNWTIYHANYYANLGNDSAMIQAAVDAAAADGEEAIISRVNARTGQPLWMIDQTILLPSNCSVVLVNAHLRMADDVCCRMFQNRNALTPLGKTQAGRQYDISIRGVGRSVLDGGKYNGISEKARGIPGIPAAENNITIYFHNVERVKVENLTIRDWRYWAICFNFCSFGTVRDMVYESHRGVPNQDGVDIHIGCSNFLIENLRGCAGDDMVAITTTALDVMTEAQVEGMSPDIHDIIVRNLNVYSANGCALIRILNHDGHKLYNVLIDGVMENSPWSDQDAVTAKNPDLAGYLNENNKFVLDKPQVLGEEGYRPDTAIRIGENFWFTRYPAEPGDTWGITIRNVSTHAQHAVTIANTLHDSLIENIRMFGNGFRAVFFNNGDMRNITFRDLIWTRNCRPHPEDEEIDIEWNDTHSRGFSAIHFSGTTARDIHFENVVTGHGLQTVFGGCGDVKLTAEKVCSMDEHTVLRADSGPANRDSRYHITMRRGKDGTYEEPIQEV